MNIKINNFLNISIHKEGVSIVSILFILFIISLSAGGLNAITILFGVFTIFSLFFFRDPERVIPNDNLDNIILSPADGIVIEVERDKELPKELNKESKIKYTKIGIEVRIYDVHVQRIPANNLKVEKVQYIEGLFVNPNLNKNSEDNERNIVLFKNNNEDYYICCVQIAGMFKRRIIHTLSQDDTVKIGDKYGIIKFGSKVDIYLPEHLNLKIQIGQTVIAGETIIANK